MVPENHWRRSLSSEGLSSADSAGFAHSVASRSHASRSTGLIALSAFRRHSSASRRYLFAAVSDVMAGSSKRGSVLSALVDGEGDSSRHPMLMGAESALDTGTRLAGSRITESRALGNVFGPPSRSALTDKSPPLCTHPHGGAPRPQPALPPMLARGWGPACS